MTRELEGAPSDTPHEAVVDDLRTRRPAVDAIQAEAVRARAERALFGVAEPPRVGRFSLLGPIAAGGMGVVYAAYDPQLDRRVALKLLHPEAPRSEVSRERLLVEARALARLDHPNVVPVHDAVTVDDQVVVVMEWVEGKSLASWERERARSWHDIVAVYRDAGRGLAAAHALGLVHRDFKPANAIIGDDGRVRVLDFGLARMADAEPTEVPAMRPRGDGLTSTGELLGTLAYMAPEQLAGATATAASDQFSFCVAMYRALCGVAPFAGANADELRAAIAAGALADPAEGHHPPRWLCTVVVRGLAADPASRHASMTVLLAELERERGWRRWRMPIAVGGAVAVALLAARLFGGAAAPSCEGGGAEIAQVWDASRRVALVRAIDRVGAPFAGEIAARVAAGLDDYRSQWVAMHRAACVDHRDGSQSDAVLDRRMTCLRRRKDALVAAVDVLGQVDGSAVAQAREVVAGLPPVADCGDLDLLASEEEPASAQTRARVAALEGRLAGAVALEHLGRSGDALRTAHELVTEARAVGHAPLLADALLTEGRILLAREERDEARGPLAAAEELSLAHGMLARAVVASARRIYSESMLGEDLPGLLRQASLIEPLSRGLRDGFARPLLLNNLGVLHMAMAHREQARATFEQARAALAKVRHPDLELTSIDRNLAMVTADGARRASLAQGVWQQRRRELGDTHLSTLEALVSYAKYLSDPAAAAPVVREACASYRAVHPELRAQRAECRAYEAFLASELGDLGGAAAMFDEVVGLLAEFPDEESRALGLLAAGNAAWCRGDPRAARAAFAAALAISAGDAWWIREAAAQARLGIGLTWRTAGEPRTAVASLGSAGARSTPGGSAEVIASLGSAGARSTPGGSAEVIASLEHAIATYDELGRLNEDVELKQRLALARLTLAAVLRSQGGADARARELEGRAAEFYRTAAPESYRARLAALTR